MEKLPSKFPEKTFSQINIAIGMWDRPSAYRAAPVKDSLRDQILRTTQFTDSAIQN